MISWRSRTKEDWFNGNKNVHRHNHRTGYKHRFNYESVYRAKDNESQVEEVPGELHQKVQTTRLHMGHALT